MSDTRHALDNFMFRVLMFYVVSIVISPCVSDFAAVAASSAWFIAMRRESMSGVATKRLLISPSTRKSLVERST